MTRKLLVFDWLKLMLSVISNIIGGEPKKDGKKMAKRCLSRFDEPSNIVPTNEKRLPFPQLWYQTLLFR